MRACSSDIGELRLALLVNGSKPDRQGTPDVPPVDGVGRATDGPPSRPLCSGQPGETGKHIALRALAQCYRILGQQRLKLA